MKAEISYEDIKKAIFEVYGVKEGVKPVKRLSNSKSRSKVKAGEPVQAKSDKINNLAPEKYKKAAPRKNRHRKTVKSIKSYTTPKAALV